MDKRMVELIEKVKKSDLDNKEELIKMLEDIDGYFTKKIKEEVEGVETLNG